MRIINDVRDTETFDFNHSIITIDIDHLINDFSLDTEGDPTKQSTFRLTICSINSIATNNCKSEDWAVDHID